MKDKLISKSSFPWVLGLTALMVAFCAAYFSVYGIATLFSGAFIAAVIMASALEIGKLVATTFLYRYWKKSPRSLKVYLTSAVGILMLITSLGIFGFLSAAFQASSLQFQLTQEKIALIESNKTFHDDNIATSQNRIATLNEARLAQEARLNEAMTNAFLSRNPLQLKQLQEQTISLINKADEDIRAENDKITSERTEISKINDEVTQLKIGSSEQKDIQTFKFVADQFGMELGVVAKYFIMAIIFVFDPLAIALVLAYNVAVFRRKSIVDEFESPSDDISINPQPEPPSPVVEAEIIKKKMNP